MKKLFKTLMLTFVLSCLTALCLATGVSAETHSGEVSNYLGEKLFWEVDTEAGTLTFSGRGRAYPPVDTVPWQQWESLVDKIILLGDDIFSPAGTVRPYKDSFERINPQVITSQWGDGFSWVYDRAAKKLTYYGKGTTTSDGWRLSTLGIDTPIDTVELTSGYVWGSFISTAKTLIVSESVSPPNPNGKGPDSWPWIHAEYVEISPDNPLYCSYDGAVYSKDGSSLYYTSRGNIQFHPNLRYLENESLHSTGETVILPWGLRSVNGYALSHVGDSTIILPDTLAFVNPLQLQTDRESGTIVVRFSKNNKEAVTNLKNQSDGFYKKLVVDIVDSVADYYPDINTTTGWQQSGGKTYYYSNGQKLTGWQVISPAWYYFDPDGSLVKNRWVKSGSSWYFLRNSNGMMSTNEWIDWYHVRYRTGPSGVMYANTWASVGGKWYYFQSSGAMAANQWVRGKDGKWYYLKGDGVMATNQWIYGKDKKWYYVGNDGVMLTNTRTPDGYYVNANGVWVR